MSALVPVRDRSGGVVAHAIVDDADLPLVIDRRWCLGSKGYVISKSSGAGTYTVRMHRLILGLERGDSRQGDHRNGNPLDNRRSNLRILTQAQNAQNRKDRRGRSLHRGVYFDVTRGKWRAQVRTDGRTYARYCMTEAEAADVAKALRQEHLPFSEEVDLVGVG